MLSHRRAFSSAQKDYNKLYFTIMDFKGATRLFQDPEFDGEPVTVYEPTPDEPILPPDERAGSASKPRMWGIRTAYPPSKTTTRNAKTRPRHPRPGGGPHPLHHR
jgi:hypothetical protein